MATGRPVAKTLIKYNSNCYEENEYNKKRSIDIEFTEQSAGPKMIKMLSSQDEQEEDEEDIALANFIESLHKQTDEEIFQKSN